MRWLFAFVVAVITAGLSAGAIDAGRSVDVAWVSVGSVVNIDVTLRNGAAQGTGMVVSRNGLVVTNNHVIRGATSVRVADVGNGRTYPARVLGYSSGVGRRCAATRRGGGLADCAFLRRAHVEAPAAGYGVRQRGRSRRYKGTRGALVFAIEPGSPAAAAGLSAGDVITTFAGRRIRSPTNFQSVVLGLVPREEVGLAWVDEFGTTGHATVRLVSGPPE